MVTKDDAERVIDALIRAARDWDWNRRKTMQTGIKPGDIIKDNDPRENGRTLTVEHIEGGYAHCCRRSLRPTHRRTRIRLDRIYTDDKPRKSGFSRIA